MMRESKNGLTLIEVIIAIAMLAAGVLAALAFQASTLRTNTNATIINQMTRVATSEMELRRQIEPTPDITPCFTDLPPGFADPDDAVDQLRACRVEFEPCTFDIVVEDGESVYRLRCGPSVPIATYRVTVFVEGPRGDQIQLQSLTPAYYVQGSLVDPSRGGGSE